jgi:hypothetical protein
VSDEAEGFLETDAALESDSARDRVGRDSFPLTHESLATLLGVRRASVSVAAQALQTAGAIVYERGMVTITSAASLHAAACECYEDCKEACRQSLPDPALAFRA